MKTTNMKKPLMPKCENCTQTLPRAFSHPICCCVSATPCPQPSAGAHGTSSRCQALQVRTTLGFLLQAAVNERINKSDSRESRNSHAAQKRSGSFTVDGEHAVLRNKNWLNRVGERNRALHHGFRDEGGALASVTLPCCPKLPSPCTHVTITTREHSEAHIPSALREKDNLHRHHTTHHKH